jgi:hypothetical protein
MFDELEWMGKEVVVAQFEVLSVVWLEGLRKTT